MLTMETDRHCIVTAAWTVQVKKAYFELALVHHPDRNNGDPESVKRFKAIKNAYEVRAMMWNCMGIRFAITKHNLV